MMKNKQRILISLIASSALIVSFSAPAALPDFTVIVDKAKDSVVNISTTTKIKKRSSERKRQIPEHEEKF